MSISSELSRPPRKNRSDCRLIVGGEFDRDPNSSSHVRRTKTGGEMCAKTIRENLYRPTFCYGLLACVQHKSHKSVQLCIEIYLTNRSNVSFPCKTNFIVLFVRTYCRQHLIAEDDVKKTKNNQNMKRFEYR